MQIDELPPDTEFGLGNGVGPLLTAQPRAERKPSRRAVLGAVAALAIAAAFLAGRVSVVSAPTTTVVGALSVTECPTTYGSFKSGPTRYPTKIAAELPVAVASQLAFYSDATRSLQPVLGPAGWSCTVGVGADGTIGVDLVPPPPTTGGAGAAQSPSASGESVIVLSEAACQGCIYSEVCPYVAASANELGYFEVTCPTTRPPTEQITWLSGSQSPVLPVSDTIGFHDPAGVKGSGDGSGGGYPSTGVLIYHYAAPTKSGPNDGLSKETCTMPPTDGRLCTAMIGNFVDRQWMLSN